MNAFDIVLGLFLIAVIGVLLLTAADYDPEDDDVDTGGDVI